MTVHLCTQNQIVGGSYAELDRDIFLLQAKFEAAPSQMIAEGSWLFGKRERCLAFQVDIDFAEHPA